MNKNKKNTHVAISDFLDFVLKNLSVRINHLTQESTLNPFPVQRDDILIGPFL